LPALLARAAVPREGMVDQGLRFIRRRTPAGRTYFVVNEGTARIDGWVPLAARVAGVALLDPMTTRTGFAAVRAAGGQTEVHLQLDPGESVVLRTAGGAARGSPWRYRHTAGAPVPLRGRWDVHFLEGGPALPAPFQTEVPVSWAGRRDTLADRFAGTARYTLTFDAPGNAADWLLDLGRVAESARVRLNGRDLGTLFAPPFRVRTGTLRRTGNVLELDVTNVSANRIRDLDRRGVKWKIFYDINIVGMDYKPLDASGWPLRPSGLLGPVTVQPLAHAPPS
ncbi:MAG TPA: hypothetical protein VF832_00050, partial [Longimicrobiales bacterium]